MSNLVDISNNVKWTIENMQKDKSIMLAIQWMSGSIKGPVISFAEVSCRLPKQCFCWKYILSCSPALMDEDIAKIVCQIVYDKILREGL